ncbi:hypothetical protein GSbR_08990 [Geobacter sp. SVR]|nr:hypothetical protein GSVR_12230 [Geobacter sp. SVR]GCF84299.1 hypothetical protein GSbR_08990 [Geobacter sp. SVR]
MSTTLFGRNIDIPPRNRDNNFSVVVGSTFFTTRLAGDDLLPIGSLYWKHRWDATRVRGIFSLFVNEFDLSNTTGKLQTLLHFDNNTIPFSDEEVVDGKNVRETSIIRGTANGRMGLGLRVPVYPYQTDNDFRVQLFWQGGYLYSNPTSDTGSQVSLPPDTMVVGPFLRVRYDGLRRNLMELPHRGLAFGLDAELMRRGTWSDANYGGAVFPGNQTRDYSKLSGYIMAAGGIPGLSERNRLILSCYGGFAPSGLLDRFSAFRIGGGPFPTESDDLYRQVYPGATFNQFPASQYLVGSAEYRRELLFFMYLHFRFTYAWVDRVLFTDPARLSEQDRGRAFSVGLTSGFFWNSQLFVEYSYDTSILHNGSPGSALLFLWSKEL